MANVVFPNNKLLEYVRNSIECKNQLKNAGDMYVGTGITDTIDGDNGGTYYKTDVISIPENYGDSILVSNGSPVQGNPGISWQTPADKTSSGLYFLTIDCPKNSGNTLVWKKVSTVYTTVTSNKIRFDMSRDSGIYSFIIKCYPPFATEHAATLFPRYVTMTIYITDSSSLLVNDELMYGEVWMITSTNPKATYFLQPVIQYNSSDDSVYVSFRDAKASSGDTFGNLVFQEVPIYNQANPLVSGIELIQYRKISLL